MSSGLKLAAATEPRLEQNGQLSGEPAAWVKLPTVEPATSLG
jgi:hypothetical protein